MKLLGMPSVALSLMALIGVFMVRGETINDLKAAKKFLATYNNDASKLFTRYAEATWTYNTNITDDNEKMMLEMQSEENKYSQESARNASQYNLTMLKTPLRRQFIKIMDIGVAAQTDETKLKRINNLTAQMTRIYNTAKVCLTNGTCLPLNPDLMNIFTTSRDYNQLLSVWTGWRDATGPKMKDLFAEFVPLSNEAVKILGHADTGAYWRYYYETATFETDVLGLFNKIKPLYEQLHAFVRRRLKALYGSDKFPSSGHIPAHLLGNMWAQQWSSLMKELTPYKDKPVLDVTKAMVEQNYTAKRIFETADNFFDSLGMIKMPKPFWEKSMLEKPKDGRNVACHATAFDFSNGVDFRIKQCTTITQSDLLTAHHEMGHVEYYLQYKDQPLQFRNGANPGFHEAIGDVIALSVQTPKHMKSIGLAETVSDDPEADINFLLEMALQKIAFIPFGYMIDQWRWKVFSGATKPDDYNKYWWNLRCKYQGISSPVNRSASDFDPGAKYHIPSNVPYIRYFVSFIVQFQFHKALCDIAGYKGPLYRCDIYNSKAAGTALSNMMKLGSSKPWNETMNQLTKKKKMNPQPLLEYFQPLLDYLKKVNGKDYGWQQKCPKL